MTPQDGTAGTRLILEPIGTLYSALGTRVDAPRQPAAGQAGSARIELFAKRNFEHALDDLEGWEMIWVVFWFHLNPSWRPKVLPPRSTTGRKGVFATRSPHRPNPVGISAVRLLGVDNLTLHLGEVDILDGTPVLDIKPYVPYSDAHPGVRSGWLDDAQPARDGAPADPVAPYQVEFDALAAAQAAWIEQRTGLDLRQRVLSTLAVGPQPHPYRRIRSTAGGYRLAVKDWRVAFSLAGREVRVLQVLSGYRPSQLAMPAATADDPVQAHREFVAAWPDSPDS